MRGTEQRAHIRHSVDLPATLAMEEAGGQGCRITDFCLGGVFTLFPEDRRHLLFRLARGHRVALQVEVNGHRGPRRISLPARVARVADDGLGLAFDTPDPADLLALQNHVRNAPGTLSGGQPGFTLEQARKVLGTVSDVFRAFLVERMAEFFVEASEALEESAAKANSELLQRPWQEAAANLRGHAQSVSRDFVRLALEPLHRAMENPATGEDWTRVQAGDSSSRLSLVDKELFEDWLTLKVMSSRAEGRFHEQLLPLQLRFDEVLGLGVGNRRNPMHPAVIASAFGEALKQVALPGKTGRAVLGCFESSLLAQLDQLYEQANQAMVRAGVLPDLDVGRYLAEHYRPKAEQTLGRKRPEPGGGAATAPVAAAAPPASPAPQRPGGESEKRDAPAKASPGAAAGSAFAIQQRIANQAYDTVKRLLDARRETAASTAARSDVPLAHARMPVVADALERMQHLDDASADMPLPERVAQAVMERGGESLHLDEELSAATEVIHHLFEGLTASPALSPRVRQAIRRLEVPFLRLLLQDEAFLQEETHPARQMLNRIADLGVRGHPNLARHEQEIDQQVERVLSDFSSDISIFETTLDKLDELNRRQTQLFQRNLKRVTEACEGRQKLLRARRRVNGVLEERIGGRRVPRAVLALIDAGWRELLVQTLLRQGEDSEEWRRYLGVLEQMGDAALATPEQEELSRLLAAIKSGLARVDETQVKNPALVGELRSLLSVKAREEGGPPPLVDVPPGLLDDSPAETPGEGESRWRRRASRFQPGLWFELREGESVQLARLAWTGADHDLFVFVNYQGMRIQEYSLDELAAGLADGSIRQVDGLEAPAVDRGLERMVQQIYEQMARQAVHDELTGLLNRREFQRRLRQGLHGEEAGGKATLVHLDVDQFKVVNNTGGQEAGDQLLRELATMLDESFSGNTVARLGGDAFALWLQGLGEDAALRAVRALCERIEGHRFQYGGQTHAVTLSCGVVPRRGPADTAEKLMQAAETACQAAKEAGRNRVQLYHAGDRDMARRDDVMVWVTRLNEALDNDRLELRCQRIEATDGNGRAPSYEILIAIRGDQGELLPPAEFIQAAERYNRMHAVDRWVVTNALRWMHGHPEVLDRIDHMSINLSGHSLNDPSMPEFLFEHFRRYPIPRERLCFEVTETTAISNLEDAADFMHSLQDLGCRFSLDDFGSGLASYGYLKHLPVDYIKIDGTFIRDMENDASDLALVRSINEMGHLMGKKTIAEYVESDAIRQKLLAIGVDYVQGYGVEQPRTLDSLSSLATPA